MASTSTLRLNSKLVTSAERIGAVYKRSTPKQIEYWAELGKAIEPVLNIEDAIAVIEGLKKIVVQPVASKRVDPDNIFNTLETKRENGELTKEVTSSRIYYEPSLTRPGLIDKVDSVTGKRQAGHFHNGEFTENI